MPKIITFLIALIFSITLTAQENLAKKDTETSSAQIKKVIETFFEGLHKGDSTIIKSTLHSDVKIQTTSTNK